MKALNRAIEDVALQQVEDLILKFQSLQQQMIETSNTALQTAKSYKIPVQGGGDGMNARLAESDALIKKLTADYKLQEAAIASLQKKLETLATVRGKGNVALENNSINQGILLRNVKEEETITSNLTTYIQKLSVERLRASRIVADYNAMVSQGIVLTEEQTAELNASAAAHKKLDTAIKAGKASIGDAREYVGQYERGTTNLKMSISRLAQELPNAGQSFQIFAMSLGNNFAAVKDSITQIANSNKALQAEGKATTSVLGQIATSVFSMDTAFYLAIAVFIAFSKQIGEFVSNLFEAKTAIDEFAEAQERYKETTVEIATSSQQQLTKLKQLVDVSKDITKSDEERIATVKELKQEYAGYLSKLSDEEIMRGKAKNQSVAYSKAMKQLTDDISMNVVAEVKQNKANEDFLKVGKKIEEEVKIRERYNDRYATAYSKMLDDIDKAQKEHQSDDYIQQIRDQFEKEAKEIHKGIVARGEKLKADKNYLALFRGLGFEEDDDTGIYGQAAINQLNIDAKQYRDAVVKAQTDIDDARQKTSLLRFKPEKDDEQSKALLKLRTKQNKDYLASDYELQHLRLTNVKNANKDIMDDESTGYDLRFSASQQYYNNLLDLANMEAKEELRVLKFNTDEKITVAENEFTNRKEQLDKFHEAGKISDAVYKKALGDAEQQLQYDRTGIIKDATNKQNIIYENQAQKLVQTNVEMVGKIRRAWDEINFEKGDLEISDVDLESVKKIGDALKSINLDGSPEEIRQALDNITKMAAESSNDIEKREAQLALDRAERAKQRIIEETVANGVAMGLSKEEIQQNVVNNLALLNADEAIIKAKKRVEEADNQATKTQAENAAAYAELKKKKNEEILQSAIDMAMSLKGLADQLFENTISTYDREIEASNDYYDGLISNAEQGSEQEQALQEEKAQREEELQTKKIAAQRRQAVFNKLLSVAQIGIDLQKTIAAITLAAAQLAATPPVTPASLAFAASYKTTQTALAIGTSAASVGAVLAVPLPQYEKGRKGGKAEAAIVHGQEVIESTDGSVRVAPGQKGEPSFTFLKAGDSVHRTAEDFEKSRGAINKAAIMASFATNNMKMSAFDIYASRLDSLPDRMEKSMEKGFRKMRINNSITPTPVIIIQSKGNFRN